MPGPFYFAWIADGSVPFDPDVHNTFDEDILHPVTVQHDEGLAAVLTIRLKNPGVGALTIGRWCWFSYDDGSSAGIQPVFKGRLFGTPADFNQETITLQFRAIPEDYVAQKTAVADGLRVLPYWDPVWFNEKKDDIDSVLETRCAVWEVDRLDLTVSASSLIDGEDGTIDVSNHLYSSVRTAFGATPLRRMVVSGLVKWKQQGEGDVDLTTPVWQAFGPTGSPFNWPSIGSFTSDGLAADWPKPLDDLGGGWSVSASAILDTAGFTQFWVYPKSYSALDEALEAEQQQQGWSIGSFMTFDQAQPNYKTYAVGFTVAPLLQHFIVHWSASRDRSEKFTFTLEADIQPQAVDLDAEDEETLDLSSENIGEEVELDTASGSLAMPIEDLRHNNYFPRPRGNLSIQCALLLAAAKMMYRARSVTVDFEVPGWDLRYTLRKSVLLHDRRLPGLQALGKITSYKFTLAGGRLTTMVKIASTVGYGVALPAADAGTDVYANGYANGYTRRAGAEVEVIPGRLVYDAIDGTVVDDDGVDLFNMNAATVLLEPIIVDNGPNDQQAVIDEECEKIGVSPDPVEALREHPTEWEVKLVPVTGGAFYTEIPITVEKLVIPKMIDLEAA